MEGFAFEQPRADDVGYAVLERMEGSVPGYLSYGIREGEVLCVFRSTAEAQEFYEHYGERIPGEGWRAVEPETEELVAVAKNFDLISVSPKTTPGATEYLLAAEDFARSLGSGS